ncbi:CRAL/TRIO domain-containing protein, partial [Martensiomyces pterosporus]
SSKAHPDIWLHRYLRAASWDVERAFASVKSVVEWRAAEALDVLNYEGEVGSGHDELRLGLSRLIGKDRLGFPLMYVKVRRIMPRLSEGFVFKRYLITIFEATQTVTRSYGRSTMLYDFTGFSMDNTPFQMVHFMVFLGMKPYADTSSVLILLVDNWLFTNFWSLIRPFLDVNLSSRIIFAKNVDEVKRFIDEDQIPVELGGRNTFSVEFVPPREGENALMFDMDGRRDAEKKWRQRVAAFEEATKEWCGQLAASKMSSNSSLGLTDAAALKRDAAAKELADSEVNLSKYVRARNIYERLGMVDEEGSLKLP